MDIVFTILSLVGFIALTAGTALFVAAEFSLTALERSTVDEAARGGDRRSRQVQHAHKTLCLDNVFDPGARDCDLVLHDLR